MGVGHPYYLLAIRPCSKLQGILAFSHNHHVERSS